MAEDCGAAGEGMGRVMISVILCKFIEFPYIVHVGTVTVMVLF